MPQRKLTAALGLLHPLSADYKNFLENGNICRPHWIRDKDMFLIPGMDTSNWAYIASGTLKAYWLDMDNREQIFHFFGEGSFITLPEDFCLFAGNDQIHIKALEESELLVFNRFEMEDVSARFQESVAHYKSMKRQLNLERNKFLAMRLKKEGERYGYFARAFPDLYRKRLLDRELCSFLGICQKTLTTSKREMILKSRRR